VNVSQESKNVSLFFGLVCLFLLTSVDGDSLKSADHCCMNVCSVD
jgi:hypothetical protein